VISTVEYLVTSSSVNEKNLEISLFILTSKGRNGIIPVLGLTSLIELKGINLKGANLLETILKANLLTGILYFPISGTRISKFPSLSVLVTLPKGLIILAFFIGSRVFPFTIVPFDFIVDILVGKSIPSGNSGMFIPKKLNMDDKSIY